MSIRNARWRRVSTTTVAASAAVMMVVVASVLARAHEIIIFDIDVCMCINMY